MKLKMDFSLCFSQVYSYSPYWHFLCGFFTCDYNGATGFNANHGNNRFIQTTKRSFNL